jgi:hypothetical protein
MWHGPILPGEVRSAYYLSVLLGAKAMTRLLEFIGLVIGLVVVFVWLIGSIAELNRQHSREIYAIWYVFSFFFLLFFALYFSAKREGKEITDLLGPSSAATLKAVYDYLTNIQDELLLVAAVVYLAIAPQLLTYVLSGLSGSATAPVFVRQIRTIALWSLIKFLAGLSGILLAHALVELLLGKAALSDFIQGFVIITMAFFIAHTQHAVFEREFEFYVWPGLWVHIRFPWLLRVHQYFTRYYREPLPSDAWEAPERGLLLDVLGLISIRLRGPVALAILDLRTVALKIRDLRIRPERQRASPSVEETAPLTKPDQQPQTDQNRTATVGGESDEASRSRFD